MAFKFRIVIDYNIESDEELNKEFKYEYYGTVCKDDPQKSKIYSDVINITKNQIQITGDRRGKIDFENCWKTKKSNYRRCILSSLFYVYNFFKKQIKIKSIRIVDDYDNEVEVPFEHEFKCELGDNQSIDLEKIEYLFKTISHKKLSEQMYRILHAQVLFINNKDFYNVYRFFNAMYTFIFTNHNKSYGKKQDKNADKQAIAFVLKLKGMEGFLANSISLAKDFFINSGDELYRLIFVWMLHEQVELKSIKGILYYDEFVYKNKDVLNLLKKLLEDHYQVKDNYSEYLPKFDAKYKRQSESNQINYLQLLSVYSQYRRNKLLHGEHVDPTFLIPDVNAEILSKLSTVIFQLSIDLMNYVNEVDFSKSKIFESSY